MFINVIKYLQFILGYLRSLVYEIQINNEDMLY